MTIRIEFKFWVLVFILVLGGQATAATNSSLLVEVNQIRQVRGQIVALIFDQKRGYPSDEASALQKVAVSITGTKATLRFSQLIPGRYVVSVFHDANGDGRLNKRFGIPREGVGVSNNIRGRFGPPPFQNAKFEVKHGETRIQIQLRYF